MGHIDVMNSLLDTYKSVKSEKKIGIFGNPIRHTLSPVIHDTLSDALGIDERYLVFQVENDLGAHVKSAFEHGILGLNITVPYKQEVMEYLDGIDEAAHEIGAVNTLVRTERGYRGYNTDMPGLARALESEDIMLQGKKVIMLGAGGAARAVAYMCMKYGAELTYIVNRTYDNAEKIAEDMNKAFGCNGMIPVAASEYNTIPKGQYLFIQCSSVGLHEGDGLPVVDDETFYEMAECGVDLIYNPSETPFLKLLKKKGVKAVNGLKMLLYQGVMAYELWNHVTIPEELCGKVYRNLCDAIYGRKIVLIGYMGAGKTTLGRYIAEQFAYDFLDTDEYISSQAGMSINEIFRVHGEDYFRSLETRVLSELMNKNGNIVISTGGGLPLRAENRKLLREMGSVYYLRACADTIYDRVKDCTDRPLLKCDDPYGRICEMLRERTPLYEAAADVCIDTDDMTLEAAAQKIMMS
ncbi:MAG: shikimate dehydrogenase [Wujia sp.]